MSFQPDCCRNLSFFFFIILSIFLPGPIEGKEKVIFGGLDWESNNFHSEVASIIIKYGYNREVDTIPGTTTPLLAALSKGDIHILMELWKDNLTEAWEKLEKEGSVVDLGVNFPDAVQGFYIPTYIIKGDPKRGIKASAPDLKSVFDLKKYKELFKDPESPNKGRFYNCILGWSCEDVNTKKFFAYGLHNDFTNFRPGTGAALSSAIASSYQQGEPFLAYYWGPTWIMGKYDLTMIDEPPYDQEIWTEMGISKRPKRATAYPIIKVHLAANKEFARNNPKITLFLKNYNTSNKEISEALAYMQEEKGRTAHDAALNFLRTKEKNWKKWVDDETFLKVKRAIHLEKNEKEAPFLDISESINQFLSEIVNKHGKTFRRISLPILNSIVLLEGLLLALPWWVFTLLISILSMLTKNKWLPLGVIICLSSIQALGLWDLSIQTLALMMISTFLSIFIGLPIGILSSRSDRSRSFLLPLLDAMQTMPSFVYLIPALMLFGLGKVPAVFATVIYAVAPIIRLTDLGIREVDQNIIEAADSFGPTEYQMLWKVKLPLALPTIMAGINQTTMMALSMVVVASMIGARGLGEQVLLGIQKLDIGKGFTAGLAIVFLSIVIDRITQGLGKRLERND